MTNITLEIIKQKIDKLVGSPLPALPEEALQGAKTEVNNPQKVISRKEALTHEEQYPIVQKAEISKVGKIPVLSVIHSKSGKYSTAIRWRSPQSLGVSEISLKKPKMGTLSPKYASSFTQYSKIRQTLFYLGDSDDIRDIKNNDFLLAESHEKYGDGIYLYSDLEVAKEHNKDREIIPVKVDIKNPYVISPNSPYHERLKNNLTNLGYDSIVIALDKPRLFNLFVFDSKSIKVLAEYDEDESISKSDDNGFEIVVSSSTLKFLKCLPTDEIDEEEYISKAVVETPHDEHGNVNYDVVESGDSIWVTVTKEGSPLQGRHILITKRPDGLFAITGGAGMKHFKEKYGIEKPEDALRHLVMGGRPKRTRRDIELEKAKEEEDKQFEPLIEKKKELMAEQKKRIKEAYEESNRAVGLEQVLTPMKLRERRDEFVKYAEEKGLNEDEASYFVSALIRHSAAKSRENVERIRSEFYGKLFTRNRQMKEATPEEQQEILNQLNSEMGNFRRRIPLEVPDPTLMRGLTKEQIDSKVGNIIEERFQEAINPDPTLDKELEAEGLIPEDVPEGIKEIDINEGVKPLEIKNHEALQNAVNKYRQYHEVKREVDELSSLINPRKLSQITPVLLEQLKLEAKALAPEIPDDELAEIMKSYDEQYQRNNSALSFYSTLSEIWNDESAINEKMTKTDNSFGEYVNSGANSAFAAMTGRFFGERFDTSSLINKTSVETAALVAAFQFRDKFQENVGEYNKAVNELAKYNTGNQVKTEGDALTQHEKLKRYYKTIQSEKEIGTISSKIFGEESELNNLMEQRKNLATALGSMQASAAFLEALVIARDARDKAVTINFGEDKNVAQRRLKELNLGNKACLDDSDPKNIKIMTGARALYRFQKAQDVLSEKYDTNEKIKTKEDDAVLGEDGMKYVKDYEIPFWKKAFINPEGETQDYNSRVEQRNDIEWLKQNNGGVITRVTGAGKSNTALGFFANKIAEDKNYSALIVAHRGRTEQWEDEAHKFTNLNIVRIPEGLKREERDKIIAKIKPGQIAVISNRDAVYSYHTIKAAMEKSGLFKGMAVDEPQEIASKSLLGNMSAAIRKLTHLPAENRIALTATPARDNIIEAYDLVNWTSHKDKALGPRARFQRVYSGYGSGTNAQDVNLQQMFFREISPHVSGDRLSNPNFKVKHELVNVSKTEIQNNNLRNLESEVDKYIANKRSDFIRSIENNPEELSKWQRRGGKNWRTLAGTKAGKKARNSFLELYHNNLHGTHGKMTWKDNPKITNCTDFIMKNQKDKHVIFIDNASQRRALVNGLREFGMSTAQIKNIASTVTSGGIRARDMARIVKEFRTDPNVKVLFLDKQSASGYNLQEGNHLHILGTPSDGANYLQAIGRLARNPRLGDVNVRTYRYTDVPMEDARWLKLDQQLKVNRATSPGLFIED